MKRARGRTSCARPCIVFVDLHSDVIALIAVRLVSPFHYFALACTTGSMHALLTDPKLLNSMMSTYFCSWQGGRINLSHAKVKTPELCVAAVKYNGLSGLTLWPNPKYVPEQTPELCLLAVQNCGDALPIVEEKTPAIYLAAVRQNGYALEYIEAEDQTPELCMEAVKQNGLAVQHVHLQTPAICLAAVQQDGWAIMYIKAPTPEIYEASRKQKDWAIAQLDK